jgi:hypothetical protein
MPKKGRPNAFERAANASLQMDVDWWKAATATLRKTTPGLRVSKPEFVELVADEAPSIGTQALQRRKVTFPARGRAVAKTMTISRPVGVRFSALPLRALREVVAEIIELAEAEWARLSAAELADVARNFSESEALANARDLLGSEGSDEEVADFARSICLPPLFAEGGNAAERYIRDHAEFVELDENNGLLLRPTAPGRNRFPISEWDFYTPEEVLHRGGPESDWAYAFRVSRLLDAIEECPADGVELAVQLGALLREWEVWREYDEFLQAGFRHFAEQRQRAASKSEKPWMTRVREDFETDRIGSNLAAYARRIAATRDLKPPSAERIKNFISELRRSRGDPLVTKARRS